MEVTINYGGQLVSVEVSIEVYEFLDCADHKEENLANEKRRHWDGREFDEHIVFTEGVGVFNGDIGFIAGIDKKKRVLRYELRRQRVPLRILAA